MHLWSLALTVTDFTCHLSASSFVCLFINLTDIPTVVVQLELRLVNTLDVIIKLVLYGHDGGETWRCNVYLSIMSTILRELSFRNVSLISWQVNLSIRLKVINIDQFRKRNNCNRCYSPKLLNSLFNNVYQESTWKKILEANDDPTDNSRRLYAFF